MTDPPPPLDPLTLLRVLADFLATQGEDVVAVGESIGVETRRLHLTWAAVDFRAHGAVDAILQVAFRPLGEEVEVEERVVGRGSSAPDAVEDALRLWWRGAVETTLRALSQREDHPAWVVGPRFQSVSGDDEDLTARLAIVDVCRQLDHHLDDDAGLHRLRVFVARLEDGQLVADCFLDNQAFAEGRDTLLAMPWPEGWWSVRQFLVRRPARHVG